MVFFAKFSCLSLAIIVIISVCNGDNRNMKNSRQKRIMGGLLADVESHPYVAAVIFGENSNFGQCGGSFITKEWILTAAHCLMGEELSGMSVYAGTNWIFDPTSTKLKVDFAIVHEEFNYATSDNDIALIKVSPPIEIDARHQPIELFNDWDDIEDGDYGTVIGYGHSGGAPGKLYDTVTLHAVNLPLFNKQKCKEIYLKDDRPFVRSTNFCAGYEGNMNYQDSCDGDSGGPFVIHGRLAGIVSWGQDCRNKIRHPSVQTNVSLYLHWINNYVQSPDYWMNVQSECSQLL